MRRQAPIKMRRPMDTISDQDGSFSWYYRVLGYSSMGSVTGSLLAESDESLEATHDQVAAFPGTTSTYVVGPFRRGRTQ